MGRTVADVAAILTAIARTDPADPATAQADAHRQDYAAALDANALQGKRVGVLRFQAGFHAGVDERFAEALDQLRAAGAEIVEIATEPVGRESINDDEFTILMAELKTDLDAYLATTPAAVTTRTLAAIIAFNDSTPAETMLFGQELFVRAQATRGTADPAYVAAIARAPRLAGQTIDRLLREHRVDALVAPSLGAAWTTDIVNGNHFVGGGASGLAAVAGYPHVTVPMGLVGGLPVGLSISGEAWSEAKLLGFAYAYEHRANARIAPSYLRSIEETDAFRAALRPTQASR
jgi:amidase